jgi:restriction system protein
VPLPDYEAVMLPFLKLLSDGRVYQMREVRSLLAPQLNLSDSELAERLPSGQSTIFSSRVGWARTYLKKAGLIETVLRGQHKITARGMELLKSNPTKIDGTVLRQFPEFLNFIKSEGEEQQQGTAQAEDLNKQTPLEALELAHRQLRQELADELLQTIGTASPSFFERLVVDLLVAMGYGGSLKDAGRAVGRSGDDGVDGIIKEDRLGLEAVYIQAKRWTATVGRPEVQSFAGSLEGHRARKGIFITTSQFTKDAQEYVTRIEKRIVLIDGGQLTQLMMDFGVGVTDVGSYHVRKLDRDYFEE